MQREMDVAKRAKVIEWLKTEVVDHVSRLFKALWEGSTTRVTDSLASLIVSSYIWGADLVFPIGIWMTVFWKTKEASAGGSPVGGLVSGYFCT
ncbi:hypothetical protein HMSSN036_05910 [Paenibacillus macerans]|nr:hypothetical protein HMSSN036_05910 [Paenibacillus macerans]